LYRNSSDMVSAILYFCSHYALVLLFIASFVVPFLWIFFLRKRKKAGFLLLILPLLAVINLIYGTNWNNSYVYNNGVKSTGVVLRIAPTNRWVNHVQQVEYQCLIRTKEGKTIPAVFLNDGNAFFPQQEIWMPPMIGEQFSLKYIPGDETNFIILTNEPGSGYASKFTCTEKLMQISPAKAAYEFDPADPAKKKAYQKVLKEYLQTPCDTNLQKVYREELKKL